MIEESRADGQGRWGRGAHAGAAEGEREEGGAGAVGEEARVMETALYYTLSTVAQTLAGSPSWSP
jgi:hypothetical protein